MYKMFVRPHLEYCIQVWNPLYIGDINKMEKVQDRFSRLLRQSSTMTPTERNHVLGITPHQTRRLRGDLIYMFKLHSNEKLFKHSTETRTRGHSQRLMLPNARTNFRKHSFALRNIVAWNALPEDVVRSPSLNTFKARLDLHLSRTF